MSNTRHTGPRWYALFQQFHMGLALFSEVQPASKEKSDHLWISFLSHCITCIYKIMIILLLQFLFKTTPYADSFVLSFPHSDNCSSSFLSGFLSCCWCLQSLILLLHMDSCSFALLYSKHDPISMSFVVFFAGVFVFWHGWQYMS